MPFSNWSINYTSGLPSFIATGSRIGLHMKIEYLRRMTFANHSQIYTPQLRCDLDAPW